MTDTVIGIYLIGAPKPLNGFRNAFAAEDLGGWPPPDEFAVIAMLHIPIGVVVALPENVPDEHKDKVFWYRKIRQSQIPDPPGEDDIETSEPVSLGTAAGI
jgi:hypothetical protein